MRKRKIAVSGTRRRLSFQYRRGRGEQRIKIRARTIVTPTITLSDSNQTEVSISKPDALPLNTSDRIVIQHDFRPKSPPAQFYRPGSPPPCTSGVSTLVSPPKSTKKSCSPSDLLKNKLKQSLSMQNLHSNTKKECFDPSSSYHTVHSPDDLPAEVVAFLRRDSPITIPVTVSSTSSLARCCCGLADCRRNNLSITEFLETYFERVVRLHEQSTSTWGGGG